MMLKELLARANRPMDVDVRILELQAFGQDVCGKLENGIWHDKTKLALILHEGWYEIREDGELVDRIKNQAVAKHLYADLILQATNNIEVMA